MAHKYSCEAFKKKEPFDVFSKAFNLDSKPKKKGKKIKDEEKGFKKSQIYVSEERHMKCGVGRCGHCMIKGKYCCTDGPVFRYDEIHP